MATRQLLMNNKPKSVELISGNPNLALAMERLCESLNIPFSWSLCKPPKNEWSLRRIWNRLPLIVQAPIHLTRHLLQRWTLRRVRQPEWFSGKDSVFLCSYFFNLDREACAGGRFYSRQWERFPKRLQRSGKKINWIHHYLPDPLESDVANAIKWMREFNRDTQKQGLHRFLDSYLSFGVIVQTLFQWSMLVFRMTRLKKPLEEAVRKHPKGWLWPLLRDDWHRSVYGTEAIQNILWVQLFDRAMTSLPQQQLGLYLCENQGWERAFIHSWKKHGHGRLIAVPHSTVRYWDLRYFDDPQVWKAKEILAQSLPDQIAVNGLAAWETLRNAHQPTDRMVEVEALRYLHLGRLKSTNQDDYCLTANKQPLKLLILGDIQRSTTDSMLQILESAREYFRQGWELKLKPHPATPVNIADYPGLKLTITNAHLEQLLPQFHIVIVSITTSAAIEAYAADLPVISILDGQDLNLSPLRGMKGGLFVSSADELKQAMDQLRSHQPIQNSDDIFWTDPELPRWKALLELVERPAIKCIGKPLEKEVPEADTQSSVEGESVVGLCSP
jgi:surface carbohydrate biosynthesis protein (TIGR04326 family)